jgi:hypothetical protein
MAGKFSNSAVYPTLDKGGPVECGSLDPYFGGFGNCCNCRRRTLGRDVDLNIAAVVGKQRTGGEDEGDECDTSHFWSFQWL